MPVLEVRARRVSGFQLLKSQLSCPERRTTLGLRWLTIGSQHVENTLMVDRLAKKSWMQQTTLVQLLRNLVKILTIWQKLTSTLYTSAGKIKILRALKATESGRLDEESRILGKAYPILRH